MMFYFTNLRFYILSGGGLTREQIVKAKINLVDLAGSERADKTGEWETEKVLLLFMLLLLLLFVLCMLLLFMLFLLLL